MYNILNGEAVLQTPIGNLRMPIFQTINMQHQGQSDVMYPKGVMVLAQWLARSIAARTARMARVQFPADPPVSVGNALGSFISRVA